jgi:hypothetical protein
LIRVWIQQLRNVPCTAKVASPGARESGKYQVDNIQRDSIQRCNGKIVMPADGLNPEPEELAEMGLQSESRAWANSAKPHQCSQKKRDAFLLFTTNLGLHFDYNGSERSLRMLKLVQNISGCFRTAL